MSSNPANTQLPLDQVKTEPGLEEPLRRNLIKKKKKVPVHYDVITIDSDDDAQDSETRQEMLHEVKQEEEEEEDEVQELVTVVPVEEQVHSRPVKQHPVKNENHPLFTVSVDQDVQEPAPVLAPVPVRHEEEEGVENVYETPEMQREAEKQRKTDEQIKLWEMKAKTGKSEKKLADLKEAHLRGEKEKLEQAKRTKKLEEEIKSMREELAGNRDPEPNSQDRQDLIRENQCQGSSSSSDPRTRRTSQAQSGPSSAPPAKRARTQKVETLAAVQSPVSASPPPNETTANNETFRLFVNNFFYARNGTTEKKVYWRCSFYDRGCRARLQTKVDMTRVESFIGTHCHEEVSEALKESCGFKDNFVADEPHLMSMSANLFRQYSKSLPKKFMKSE